MEIELFTDFALANVLSAHGGPAIAGKDPAASCNGSVLFLQWTTALQLLQNLEPLCLGGRPRGSELLVAGFGVDRSRAVW